MVRYMLQSESKASEANILHKHAPKGVFILGYSPNGNCAEDVGKEQDVS